MFFECEDALIRVGARMNPPQGSWFPCLELWFRMEVGGTGIPSVVHKMFIGSTLLIKSRDPQQ